MDRRDEIGCYRVSVLHALFTVRIGSRYVKKVDACEDDKETGKQRYRIYSVRSIETAVEYKGGRQSSSSEGDVVNGIDAIRYEYWKTDFGNIMQLTC